jgi:methionyl aminopeptidase
MSERQASSIVFAWIAKLIGYRDQRDPSQEPENRSVLGVTPEEVRRASEAVATRPIEVIMEESRRLAPVASDIVRHVGHKLTPGATTIEIAEQLVSEAKSRDVLPAMLGYKGFPAAAAVSINDELLHGIPSNRRIVRGDLVKIEFGIVSNKAFAASSWTFSVGAPSPEDAALLRCGTTALRMAIEAISPTGRLGDIGAAIQAEAERAGFEVIRAFVGYGMGQQRIQAPQIPATGRKGMGARLRTGWILNVHVILKHGTPEIEIAGNQWTALASDKKRGCIFTCMVEVTADGHRVLSTR